MENLIDKAAVLIEALPYFQQFRDAVVVIKFGGSAMENSELVKSTMRDVVFMECVGMRPVIVHGGGKAISKRLRELKIDVKFINGLRYTSEEVLKIVDDVLHNEINAGLIKLINEFGGRAESISGKDIIEAEKLQSGVSETGEPLDYGFVGKIVKINPAPILALTEKNIVPVITPLGKDKKCDRIYNINADTAACKIAEALKAAKLVYLSDVPGVLRDPDDEESLIPTIHLKDINTLIKRKIISGGMLPKVESSREALKQGVKKVHTIDGRIKHSLLLEIFTDSGIGTQIVK